ncbi:MAG: GGDEF domain-containing protein [Pseudomonadota bacterium]|nr:GGDEF domain-containing protein [Pseudomonadota bacterium]
MKTTTMTVVSSLLQSLLIGMFAWTGAATWSVAFWFFLLSAGSTAFFLLVVRQGWNLRFKDRWLLWAQLLSNYAIQLVFIVASPKLWMIFLASSLVSFNYAMLSFTPRQFRWTWLGFGATTGLALWIGRDRFAYPAPSSVNVALLWLFFFLAVRRLGLIGMQFSTLRAELSQRNRQLTLSLTRIQELASQDDLTGVFNRRHFMDLLQDERERSHRTQQPYSVALFDLDHFKTINDRFGHAGGDAVLRNFCTLVQAHMRVTDRFARWGGEEFVLLMPVTTPVESASLAVERIRSAVASHDWSITSVLPAQVRVTVSAGVATCVTGESVEALIARADAALYQAKDAGRNCFVMAP